MFFSISLVQISLSHITRAHIGVLFLALAHCCTFHRGCTAKYWFVMVQKRENQLIPFLVSVLRSQVSIESLVAKKEEGMEDSCRHEVMKFEFHRNEKKACSLSVYNR